MGKIYTDFRHFLLTPRIGEFGEGKNKYFRRDGHGS